MNESTRVLLVFVLGAILSVVLPWARDWLDSRDAFDWRKIVGQLLTVLMTIIGQVIGLVDALGDATTAEALAMGWFISSAGRLGQKSADVVRAKLNGK